MVFDALVAIACLLFLAVIIRAELRLKPLEQDVEELTVEPINQRQEIAILRSAKSNGRERGRLRALAFPPVGAYRPRVSPRIRQSEEQG